MLELLAVVSVTGVPLLLLAILSAIGRTRKAAIWWLRLWLAFLGWEMGMGVAVPPGNEKADGATGLWFAMIFANVMVAASMCAIVFGRPSTRHLGKEALLAFPLFFVTAAITFIVCRVAFPEWRPAARATVPVAVPENNCSD